MKLYDMFMKLNDMVTSEAFKARGVPTHTLSSLPNIFVGV